MDAVAIHSFIHSFTTECLQHPWHWAGCDVSKTNRQVMHGLWLQGTEGSYRKHTKNYRTGQELRSVMNVCRNGCESSGWDFVKFSRQCSWTSFIWSEPGVARKIQMCNKRKDSRWGRALREAAWCHDKRVSSGSHHPGPCFAFQFHVHYPYGPGWGFSITPRVNCLIYQMEIVQKNKKSKACNTRWVLS